MIMSPAISSCFLLLNSSIHLMWLKPQILRLMWAWLLTLSSFPCLMIYLAYLR